MIPAGTTATSTLPQRKGIAFSCLVFLGKRVQLMPIEQQHGNDGTELDHNEKVLQKAALV